jgi:hypothetical protein
MSEDTPGQKLLKYTELLGMCWGNFNSLELMLRVFLTKKAGATETGFGISEGDECAISPMTDFRSFRELVKDYNAQVAQGESLLDAERIARFRDAMAHGRVLSRSQSFDQLIVYKFSKPDKNRAVVRLEIKESLTVQYLKEMMDLMRTNLTNVGAQIERLH